MTSTHSIHSLQPSRSTSLVQRSPLGSLRSLINKVRSIKVDSLLIKDASLVFGYLLAGWSDASPGSLLPAIQQHYQINFIIVSIIFLCNLVGWILSAILTPMSLDRLGFGPTVTLAAGLCIIPPVLVLPLPPFGLLAASYVLSGLSIGAQEALANSFMASRPKPHLRLASLHFTYGLGALCAPLAAAEFLKKGLDFSWFYSVILVLAVLNTIGVTWSFKLEKTKDGMGNLERETSISSLELENREPSHNQEENVENEFRRRNQTSTSASQPPSAQQYTTTSSKFNSILSQSNVWILSIFALLYVGTEVAIGGWSSSYIIETRGSIQNSNYIVSGFWAGLAFGRVLLIPVTAWIGEQLSVLIYMCLAVALQFIVWLVPDLIANAVSLAIMGLLIGPIFPIMISVATRKIRPRILHPSAIGFIVSFGSAGSALFPLIVGLVAQSRGITVLAPILLALLSAQVFAWLALGWPVRRKGEEENERRD